MSEPANDVETWTHRVARKTHRCIECQDVIHPGKEYVEVCILDGSWARVRLCLCCADWAAWALEYGVVEWWTFGELEETIAYYTECRDGSYRSPVLDNAYNCSKVWRFSKGSAPGG